MGHILLHCWNDCWIWNIFGQWREIYFSCNSFHMNRVFYIIGILPFHRCFFWTSQSENKVKKSVFLPSVCSFLLAVTQQCYQQQDLLCLFWKHSCQPSRDVMDRKPHRPLLALLNSVTVPWTDHLLCGPWMYVLPLGASFPHMQSVSDITSQGWVGTTPGLPRQPLQMQGPTLTTTSIKGKTQPLPWLCLAHALPTAWATSWNISTNTNPALPLLQAPSLAFYTP